MSSPRSENTVVDTAALVCRIHSDAIMAVLVAAVISRGALLALA
ncbi:hypothetical protein OG604_03680 [Streptomyces sp. NBC_01231]|nr:hypothetical protein OG604_03680 [Streptomyces sp. NBC_01231]